jgi:pilus assembly protein Flp/PilA
VRRRPERRIDQAARIFLYGGLAMIRSFFAKEEGQGLVEYALILALIAIVVIGVLTLLGKNVNNKISQIGSALNP